MARIIVSRHKNNMWQSSKLMRIIRGKEEANGTGKPKK